MKSTDLVPKGKEATRNCSSSTVHDNDFGNVLLSLSIIRINTSKRTRGARDVNILREVRNAHKILGGKIQGMKTLGTPAEDKR